MAASQMARLIMAAWASGLAATWWRGRCLANGKRSRAARGLARAGSVLAVATLMTGLMPGVLAGGAAAAPTGGGQAARAGLASPRIISTVAGGVGGPGPAASAELSDPSGVALNAAGDLLIADHSNSMIRMVTG
jgi:hypothetical protein